MTLATIQQKVFSMLYLKDDFDPSIFSNDVNFPIKEGFSIYEQSREIALLDTLQQTYEVCLKLTGDEFFNAMAALYIKETPSLSANIDDYGESFAEFIDKFEYAESLPYLADTAKLEWCWHKALHAKNTNIFDAQKLAHISEKDHPKIVFELPESISLISSSHAIDKIWAFNQKDYVGPETLDINITEPVKLLVWRKAMDTRIDPISANDWDFLHALDQGIPMGELDKVLDDEQAEHLSEMLVEFLKKGYIAGYHLHE